MIAVSEAVQRIIASLARTGTEKVALSDAGGRVLAADTKASFAQPPADMSAMDGYAVRASDAKAGARLKLIGVSPAGNPYAGAVGASEAVRIFTGGVVPEGADAVVIQEDTKREGDTVVVGEPARPGQHIRRAGLDFQTGDVLVPAGKRLTGRDITLLASADFPALSVAKRPRVALIATGDELSRPGELRGPGGIVASTLYGLAAMVRNWGGEPLDIGILRDTPEAFAGLSGKTQDADILVTLGGASVGDHDLVQSALQSHGFVLDFWKIAMRPGKPLIFGRLKDKPLLGLPGNPVSAQVCAILFLRPAIAAMQGAAYAPRPARARLTAPLKANDTRQDYVRARLSARDGALLAEPFAIQDSSMQTVFAEADALIVRPPHAPAADAGTEVEVLLLDDC